MSRNLNSAVAVIGIDIGKNSFHVVGLDDRGAIVLRQKWSRGQIEARLANLPPCLIGMEACVGAHHLSRKLKALGHDARLSPHDVRFSNRPFRVKHFQTIRRCSVDVAHGLALLFGIGAKALPLWDSRMRWSNLCSGLAVRRNGWSKRTCELTSSIVPRGTSSTARWSSSFLLLDLIL
jgi:hypothetical protein